MRYKANCLAAWLTLNLRLTPWSVGPRLPLRYSRPGSLPGFPLRKGFREMKATTCLLAMALLATTNSGCTPNRPEVRNSAAKTLAAILAAGASEPKQGQLILPKRVGLKVAIIPRPFEDPVVNETLWSTVDEQVISPEMRRSLEANGLRLGILSGNVPPGLEAMMGTYTPVKDRVAPVKVEIPDGEHTDLTAVHQAQPVVSLLLNRDGRVDGKEFRDAKGLVRLTVGHSGANTVSLKFTPEIHHGPIKHTYGVAPNAGPFAPQQFIVQDGQEVESLRELAGMFNLMPGQVAVLGCRGKRDHSLGDFLFIQQESNSDRLTQSVMLIWAWKVDGGVSNIGHDPASEMPKTFEPSEPPSLGEKDASPKR